MRIGLDIGGTKTDAIVLGSGSAVLHRLIRPTGRGNAAVIDGAEDAIHDLLAVSGLAPAMIEQIGVGIPGSVSERTGIVRRAVNLNVADLDIAAALSTRFGAAVVVENDVKAAALGAYRLLNLRGSIAYLNLGTGLAAGIVEDGRLWRGARGGAGEIGHIPVAADGVRCSCGQYGCLETLASGSGLARLWPSATATPALDLFDRADAGEQVASAVRAAFVAAVASAVRILLLSADVETIVIGGGLSNLGERLTTPLRETLREWSRTSSFLAEVDAPTRVRILPPETSAAAVGAALLEAPMPPPL